MSTDNVFEIIEPARATNSSPFHLIMNADDWGLDDLTTDHILACIRQGAVSSTSAMVFMTGSKRAADLAGLHNINTGLHLNLTEALTESGISDALRRDHASIARFLCGGRLHQLFRHPGLTSRFRTVVTAQIDEYARLYGAAPQRVDGHHHMHLCANVLSDDLLPEGVIARRNFSFQAGEKSILNRIYRRHIDRKLARRHPVTDYFFALVPIDTERLKRICSLARHAVVELETHPAVPAEYEFLMSGKLFSLYENISVMSGYTLPAY